MLEDSCCTEFNIVFRVNNVVVAYSLVLEQSLLLSWGVFLGVAILLSFVTLEECIINVLVNIILL